jgi:hypothetical protein
MDPRTNETHPYLTTLEMGTNLLPETLSILLIQTIPVSDYWRRRPGIFTDCPTSRRQGLDKILWVPSGW